MVVRSMCLYCSTGQGKVSSVSVLLGDLECYHTVAIADDVVLECLEHSSQCPAVAAAELAYKLVV